MRTKLLVLAAALAAPVAAFAAGGGAHYEAANVDITNKQSLQRGAANFVNYCLGCHSAQYVRYNRMAADLGLTEQQLIDNLMFTAESPHQTMRIGINAQDAKRWFGVVPPDLSLIARSRGTDYIYTFLRSFYADPAKASGWNNTVLPGTAMPHVLWELQGYQNAVFSEHTEGGVTTRHFEGFETLSAGSLDEEGYDEFVRDTVNFLVYIAEPIRSERRTLGVWVLIYLIFFWIIAVMLKKQIWKDV